MSAPRLHYLFNRYITQDITEPEKGELMLLIENPENQEALENLLHEIIHTSKGGQGLQEESKSAILDAIFQAAPGKLVTLKKPLGWKKWVAAAAVLIILGTGSYFMLNQGREIEIAQKTGEKRFKNDIAPGNDAAILRLADGREMILDSASDGKITDQATKTGNQISYLNATNTKPEYNTISTKKGGKYNLILADGTIVTLDAESSIRYPTAFFGKERKIEINGQAYFKVAHDVNKPFIVQKNDIRIQVLGTEFNVEAYDDESNARITLLEGSVNVLAGTSVQASVSVILKPAEQAIVLPKAEEQETRLSIHHPDLESVIAWKKGFLDFNQQDITAIMRQLSRWYHMDIRYEGKVPEDLFSGIISRDNNLSQVLKKLELTKRVHFWIDGKKVVVLP
jgi:transmembrane sensor